MRKLCLLIGLSLTHLAWAEPVHIVAFGASNTFGKGVSRSDAYPAQLERLLKSEGYDVVVENQGLNGITTEEGLAHVDSAIPDDTRIVILQPGTNDRVTNRKHFAVTGTQANINAIVQKLLDRKMLVLFTGSADERQALQTFDISMLPGITELGPPEDLQGDQQHFTPEGYRVVAQKMLPLVKALLDKLANSGAPPNN